ncbi:MAG TPA: YhjD/YihY/BrkB family envelope integrity protein [Thermoanaerobaculia bacterium]|jgi:membrane protein
MSTAVAPREKTAGWSLRRVLAETFRGFRADRGLDLAASLSFTSLLTAIPLLVTFSLFLATFFQENDDQILTVVNAILPYQTTRLMQNLGDFVRESTAISTVGLILLIIASVRLIFVVEGVFNAVWGAPRRRARLTRVILYTFALVALGLVLGGIFWGLRVMRKYVGWDSVLASPAFGAVAPFLLKAFFLTLLYRFLPNAKVRWLVAAVAGALVSLALELLRLFFGLYVDALLRMNLITGSLAFLLFAVLSLYFAWVLILLGVELTHVLQTETAGGAESRREGRAERAIRMLLRMSSHEPAPLADLEPNPEAPSPETIGILQDLAQAGLVSGDATSGFRLAAPGRDITVARVVDALMPGLYDISPSNQDRVALVLEPLFYRLDAERRALLNATLADLRRT